MLCETGYFEAEVNLMEKSKAEKYLQISKTDRYIDSNTQMTLNVDSGLEDLFISA